MLFVVLVLSNTTAKIQKTSHFFECYRFYLYFCKKFLEIMREMIDCFLPDLDRQAMATTLSQLDDSKAVRSVFWMEGPLASSNSVMSIA
jgi:hypothetical protein